MGRVRIRPEVVGALIWAAIVSLPAACTWLAAILVHELGHGVLGAWAVGHRPRLDVQLGAGDAYFEGTDSQAQRDVILLCGLVPLGAFAVGLEVAGWTSLPAWVWLVHQAWPFPASDGGVFLRDRWSRHRGRLQAFREVGRLGWTLAALLLGLLFLLSWMTVWAWALAMVGLAVWMARSEWPGLLAQEVHFQWSQGDHAEALRLSQRVSRGSVGLQSYIREIGLRSAMELEDVTAAIALGSLLPETSPTLLEAADWLVGRDHATGARWTERVLDAFDRAPGRWADTERDQLQSLVVAFALFEARAGRIESAARLLERAQGLGPVDFEWLAYRPEAGPVLAHPRVEALRGNGGFDEPSRA